MKKKIIYIYGGLYSPNGMSYMISQKVNYLADYTDFEMGLVLTERPNAPRYYQLSKNVKSVNFDINFDELDTMPFFKKICFYWFKQHRYKKLLTSYLLSERADIVVSVTRREINFLTKINDGSKKIAEIHFARIFYRQINKKYFPSCVNQLLSRLWMNSLIRNLKHLERFVVLTNEDKENWPELNNVIVIPNFVSNVPNEKSNLSAKRVIAVGRYSQQKGFDMLIHAWKIVNQVYPDWQLHIFGPGNKDVYQEIAVQNGLNEVVFCHHATNDIYSEYLGSSVFVLSSRYEGFGLVIVEAMGAGLPVVSFSCPCGPKDIITEGVDGFLVEPNNVNLLAERLCMLMGDESLRKRMGENSAKKVSFYSQRVIMDSWIKLFEEL